jgi:hypothetical protein
VVVATVVALGTWAAVRLLGVELTVGKGAGPSQVGAVEVVAATVLAIVGAILIAGFARFAGAGGRPGRRAQWTPTR